MALSCGGATDAQRAADAEKRCHDFVVRVHGADDKGRYDRLRAVEAGVFGYLVKPFREQDLVPAIAAAQARRQALCFNKLHA